MIISASALSASLVTMISAHQSQSVREAGVAKELLTAKATEMEQVRVLGCTSG